MAIDDLNRIFLSGRLAQDPNFKPIGESGVCEFTIANHRVLRGSDGKRTTKTIFIPCECWGPKGNGITKHLKQGDTITIEGKLDIESWEMGERKNYRPSILVTSWQIGEKAKANLVEEETAVPA